MGLIDFKNPTERIQFPGGEIVLRGLSLVGITWLVNKHKLAIEIIVDSVKEDGGFENAIPQLLTNAPLLAGDIIAVAADEPDMGSVAATLPFPVQVEALEKIGNLTFSAEGGVKKFVETVTRVLAQFNAMRQTM